MSEDQLRLMFQSLLQDRFKLRVHHENRELPEYELAMAGGKSKLIPSGNSPMTVTIEGKSFTQGPGTCGVSGWLEGSHLTCHAAAVDTIAEHLTGILHSPVVNRTGLTGTYDANVLFIQNGRVPDTAESAPPMEEAVREEPGLRLQKATGSVDVRVIDHIEKPSAN